MNGEGIGSAERVAARAAVVTAVGLTAIGFGALAAGVEEGWLVLAIGWGTGVPLASGSVFLVANALAGGLDAPGVSAGDDGTESAVPLAAVEADESGDPDPAAVRNADLGRSERS